MSITQMTTAERLRAALEGRPVDHVPFSPFLAYVWESYPESIRRAGQLAFLREVGADPLWRGAPCPVQRQEAKGVTVREVKVGADTRVEMETPVGTLHWRFRASAAGNTSFLIEHPLKTAEDCRILQWVEEHRTYSYAPEAMREHLAGEGREGLSLGMLLPRGKTAYQSLVEHHMGTEELVYALEDYPETVESLWQVMVANDLAAAELAVEAEYDYFLTWEDSSTQNYSPTQYDRYIGHEIRMLCACLARAGKRYVQHACGHLRELVTRMADTGVTVIESLSPPPTGNIALREARALVGDRVGIIGGIEPTVLLRLDIEHLEPYVVQALEDGRGGPFILANSDSCPPGVTPEKFAHIAAIARRTPG